MNFDKRFNTYNENAYIQKHVAKNLVKFLSEMGVEKRKKALEIGCGTGIFSKKFIENFLPSQLFLNDIYDVEKYLKDIKYNDFILGDIENIDLPRVDIVVSSSVFQWLKDFKICIEKIYKSSEELGFSMYITGNLKEIREHFGVSLKYLSIDEIVDILKSIFAKVEWREEKVEIEFNTPMEALKHLKNTGVTGIERTSIQKIRSYKEKKLTYRVGYFYCKN